MTIYVSQGMKQYVGGTITELTGEDITGATFQVSLGTSLTIPPTVWSTPDVSAAGTGTTLNDGTPIPGTAQRILKILIATQPVGTYYVWAKITDNPEIEPVVFPDRITLA
jgi:hypothetical protein